MPPRAMIYCHECHTEGFPLMVDNSPICPSCSGSFIEEVVTAQQGAEVDREDLAAAIAAGGGGGEGQDRIIPDGTLEFQIEDNGMGGARIIRGPGVTLIQGNTGGNNGANNPLGAILQAFGLRPPVVQEMGGELGNNDVDDPDDMPIAGGSGSHTNNNAARQRGVGAGAAQAQAQVPIRNLASFLTNAFAAPQHYADHPSNNPFAEDTPPPQTAAEQAQEAAQLHEEAHARAREEARQLHSDNWERDHPGIRNPHHLPAGFILGGRNVGNNIRMRNGPPAGVGAVGGLRVVPGPPNENQSPMNYLVSLINSIGGGLFDASGERRSNLGDYAFGDAGFASILQDLMEQAQGRAGPQPATPEIIAALPRTKVTSEMLNSASPEDRPDCPICQETLVLNEELTTLPCSHVYHSECVDTWLATSGTCPSCRYALVPQTGDIGGANDPVGTGTGANVEVYVEGGEVPPLPEGDRVLPPPLLNPLNPFGFLNQLPIPIPQAHQQFHQQHHQPQPLAQSQTSSNSNPNPNSSSSTSSSTSTTTTRRSNPEDPNSPLITTVTTTRIVNTGGNSTTTTSSSSTSNNSTSGGGSEAVPGAFPGMSDEGVYMEDVD